MNKKEWEKWCLEKLKETGGVYTIFWATSNKFISNAMDRLVKKYGVEKLRFPYHKLLNKGV